MPNIFTKKRQEILIDNEDLEKVSKYKWYVGQEGYVQRSTFIDGKKSLMRLHNFITGYKFIDHINRNKLDNRKSNLRKATSQENSANAGMFSHNTSGYRGVSYIRKSSKWRSYIKFNQKQMWLGQYDSAEKAALAYNKKARELFGQFAYLNEVK